MKVIDILKSDKVTISCEMFPPKLGSQLDNYKEIVREMAAIKPAYLSCTYGATGGTSDYTVEIADTINKCGIPAIAHLTCASSTKEKVEAGCDYLTTQMFFDNNIFYNFMYKVLKKGIEVPVVPGIMPVTNAKQIKRIVSLSGNLVPAKFLNIVDRFADNDAAMKQAGIAYATEQIIDLIANGTNHIHIYSMNHPDVAGAIFNNLSDILD